jgi:hypothetical protein
MLRIHCGSALEFELAREEAKPIAEELDIADRCWRNWLRQTDIDQGDREELTTRNARSCRGLRARTGTGIEMHRQSRGTYGSPRVRAELRLGAGIRVFASGVDRLIATASIQHVIDAGVSEAAPVAIPAVPSDDLINHRFTATGPMGSGCPTSPSTPPTTAGSISRSCSTRGPNG